MTDDDPGEALPAGHRQPLGEEGSLAEPVIATEADFDEHALERVFVGRLGPACGRKTLGIAGVQVHRRPRRMISNSGRTKGWEVSFVWFGADGERHTLPETPGATQSRRHDPLRNWGMGRKE